MAWQPNDNHKSWIYFWTSAGIPGLWSDGRKISWPHERRLICICAALDTRQVMMTTQKVDVTCKNNSCNTQMLHGAGIFTYIWVFFLQQMLVNIPCMEHME